jgi:hypothetical protein
MKTDAKPTENTAENGNKSKPLLPVVFFSTYFPYGLKVNYKEGMHYGNSEIIGIDNEGIKIKGINLWVLFKNAKPILKPLSDLKNDENFDLYMDLCEQLEVHRCDNLLLALENEDYYSINIQKYHIIEEFMNKNHFDWKYNLIADGLAISIHDVE